MPQRIERTTRTEAETRDLARRIGRLAPDGLVIALCGDLGSGKTVFVQGLAHGLEVPTAYYVTSPSYTLVNEYPGRLRLYHADLYRLDAPVDLDGLGLLDAMQTAAVVAIEWAERCREDLPDEHLDVRMTAAGAEARRVVMTAYGPRVANLLKRLDNQP